MKFNKKFFLTIFGFVLLISLVSPCIAIMMKKTEVTETFQKGIVSCAVHESLDETKISQTDAKIYGDEVNEITVENTGNVGVYVRVKLISYWEDSDGKITSDPSETLALNLDTQNWIEGSENTYYFKSVLKPGQNTPSLCEAFTLQSKKSENDTNIYQVVQIIPEAIQSELQSEISKVWNVNFSNNNISSIKS